MKGFLFRMLFIVVVLAVVPGGARMAATIGRPVQTSAEVLQIPEAAHRLSQPDVVVPFLSGVAGGLIASRVARMPR
jgi:hypothetical protein